MSFCDVGCGEDIGGCVLSGERMGESDFIGERIGERMGERIGDLSGERSGERNGDLGDPVLSS